MTADGLFRAILADPADDLPRLVYADWLDDAGDPARADFIRVQCELARLPDHDPRRPALEDREHDLLSEHEPRWLEAGAERWHEWEFRRGFVEQVTAPADAAPSEATANTIATDLHLVSAERAGDGIAVIPLFDLAESLDLSAWHEYGSTADVFLTRREWPRLTALNLSHRPGLSRLPELLSRCPFRPRLKELSFGGRTGPNFAWADAANETLDAAGFAALAGDMPLERLSAFDCGLEDDGLRQLFKRFGPQLVELNISANTFSDDAWQGFRNGKPQRLARLDLSSTSLGERSLSQSLNSGLLDSLTDLDISRCEIGLSVNWSVASSAYWRNAVSFRAHSCDLTRNALAKLCRAQSPSLRLVDLAGDDLGTLGVESLNEARWAETLTWLALTRNSLDDDAAGLLAGGPFCSLRTLHLAHNDSVGTGPSITNAAVRALADAPSLANLRILTVSYTNVGDIGIEIALNAPHWRLSGLGVAGCDLSPYVVNILARSPRLARLQWLDLSRNPRLSGDALLPLAESPYLSRLCELDIGGVYVGERTRQALRQRLGRRLSE